MMRMDLGDATIWDADLGLTTTAKMLLGMDVTHDVGENHAETTL